MSLLIPDQTRSQRDPAAVPALDLRNVTKRFGDVQAVDGLSLTVQPGEVVAFLGPNGAGKTTTIDLLLGLSEPTSGSVQVLGRHPRHAVAAGQISAVMQTGGLLKDLTVAETVEYIASLFPRTITQAAAMERAGITELATRLVGKCSGGEQQRLRFALALLPDPSVLILDEPTTGMDVGARHSFWEAIHADARNGRTVLFATHYLEEADQYADRIIMLDAGRKVADGTGSQIRAMADGRTVRATFTTMPDLALVPGVDGFEARGDVVTFHAVDSDAALRWLLTHTDAHDLEVTSQALESAFLSLTGKDAR